MDTRLSSTPELREAIGSMEWPASSGTPANIYCSICDKPFNEELSHRRHEQYCGRRAAKNLRSRPKACSYCRRTKTKCDFKQPCSRCVSKEETCLYEKNHPKSSKVAAAATVSTTALPSFGIPPGRDVAGSQTSGATEEALETLSVCRQLPPSLNSQMRSRETIYLDSNQTSVQAACADASAILEDAAAVVNPQLDVVNVGDGALLPSANMPYDTNQLFTSTLPDFSASFPTVSIAAMPSFLTDVIRSPGYPYMDLAPPSRQTMRLSSQCRQHLMSMFPSYPRMMLGSSQLPPFIHPLACSLHYPEDFSLTIDSITSSPLKPIATCQKIAHIFVSRKHLIGDSLQRVIKTEHCRINDEMDFFSQGETLSALQAMVMYSIMRMTDEGFDDFHKYLDMVKTMGKLSRRLHLRSGSPSPNSRTFRPRWVDWLFDESCRRVNIVCLLLDLILDGLNGFPEPLKMPLISPEGLWDARTAQEWGREYDKYLREVEKCGHGQLISIGDAAAAYMQQPGQGSSKEEYDEGVQDALEIWHAGLDGLGMLLAMVISDTRSPTPRF